MSSLAVREGAHHPRDLAGDDVGGHADDARPPPPRGTAASARRRRRGSVKSSGSAARSWLTRSTLPPASLMATTFGQSAASRRVVSTPISTPHREGTLYRMHRQLRGLRDGAEMPVQPFLRGLVVIRAPPPAPRPRPGASASRVMATASRVEFEPVPAMTLQRARAPPRRRAG